MYNRIEQLNAKRNEASRRKERELRGLEVGSEKSNCGCKKQTSRKVILDASKFAIDEVESMKKKKTPSATC